MSLKNLRHVFKRFNAQKTARFSFSCKRCGQCCRDRGFVYFTKDDIRRASKVIGMKEKEFAGTYLTHRGNRFFIKVGDNGCSLLTENGCRIQNGKPVQCSSFPYWDEYIGVNGELVNFDRECPGITKVNDDESHPK
ncbi:MAG: YkgJ family cysteine cluster protein [Spirochaetes bacterium]|nr:YkgJ family cysteine cluster protein [Spirochaetota bacterium]